MTTSHQSHEARAHAVHARQAKRHAAEALGIDESFICRMVDGFYASIRNDDLLGPIFAERISDWPPHLARMKQFWRSILHNSGEFSGILGIAAHDSEFPSRWKVNAWATQAALSRPGRRKFTDKDVKDIKFFTFDSETLRWPRGSIV